MCYNEIAQIVLLRFKVENNSDEMAITIDLMIFMVGRDFKKVMSKRCSSVLT